jgi:PiT family inorganic phosphate transporter
LSYLLIVSVALLSFANGANDNFKGVATLWGARHTSYERALAWATSFTLLGSITAMWLAAGLVVKFNGSKLLSSGVYAQLPFLVGVALGAAITVLLACRLGFPISTTHALTGGLVGAGIAAVGFSQVKFAALASGVAAPLLFSPLAALLLTVELYPWFARVVPGGGRRDCFCVDQAELQVVPAGASASVAVLAPPAVRWANGEECQTGAEVIRAQVGDVLHWFSGAAISFARGLNDTPKIAALLLVGSAAGARFHFGMVAVAMAVGGILGATRVARTLSHKIAPMATEEAVTANLVAAGLVTLASFWALPVSTTHLTSGSIFGIGVLRRGEADWRQVRDILLSWVATLPLGALLAASFYALLAR